MSSSEQLERLESRLEIAQLPSRYAMALDARDLDTLVALFVDDVDTGAQGSGREALKRWYDQVLRRFYRNIDLICGHVIDFVDADHATGSIYCRAEHEDGDGWYVITVGTTTATNGATAIGTSSSDVSIRGTPVDVTERPGPKFVRWPTDVPLRAEMPHRMPTWRAFWDRGDPTVPARLSRRP